MPETCQIMVKKKLCDICLHYVSICLHTLLLNIRVCPWAAQLRDNLQSKATRTKLIVVVGFHRRLQVFAPPICNFFSSGDTSTDSLSHLISLQATSICSPICRRLQRGWILSGLPRKELRAGGLEKNNFFIDQAPHQRLSS